MPLLSGCLKGFYEEKKKIPSIERTVQLKCSNYSFRLAIFPRVLCRSVSCIDDNERNGLLDGGEGRKKK